MSKQKSQFFTEAIVGVFMIAVILLLAYFTIVISGVDIVTGDTKCDINIAFSQVGGLKEHEPVMYRGTKVGVVRSVEVTPTNLIVHASIDRNVVLREHYLITVRNLSMLGGNYLALEEGSGRVLKLATTAFVGETPTDWMQDMKEVAQNIRRFTEMEDVRSVVSNFNAISIKTRAIAERVDEIMERVQRGDGTVGRLLSADNSLYEDFKTAVAEAKSTFTNAKEISQKLNRDKMFDDLEAGIAGFRKATESFDPKSMDFSELKAKAQTLLDNLNAVSEKLKSGEGTIGKLANDPELYDELNGLIKDVRQTVDNFRDTTPISTFSSLATGAL